MASAVPMFVGLVLVGLGVAGLLFGTKRRRQYRTISGTETTDVLSITPGPVEVTGTAKPAGDGVMRAPFSEADCLLAEWGIEEWEEAGKHASWETKGSGVERLPFVVDDGTGEVLVRPAGAEVDLDETVEETIEVGATEEPPGPIREFLALDATPGPSEEPLIEALDWGTTHGDRRYRQHLLAPGDEVYVYGTATREPGDEWGRRNHEIVDGADDGEASGARREHRERLGMANGERERAVSRARRTTSDSSDGSHADAELFLVSDYSEAELIEDRRDYRLYLGGGVLALLLGIAVLVGRVLPV